MSASLAKQWLEKAEDDLEVAKITLRRKYYAHVCFLAQQCIEKSLKGYLVHASNAYPRTHKLVDLLGECVSQNLDFNQFLPGCIIIDQYYIPTRYPDGIPGGGPGGLPDHSEAKEAIEIAASLLEFVQQQIG